MIKTLTSFSVCAITVLLLNGCVPGETPQSSLYVNAPITAEYEPTDFANSYSVLPNDGPVPETRPYILSLNSGQNNILNTKAKYITAGSPVLQAMVEPDKQPQFLEPAHKSAPQAEPVVASSSEQDCLIRTMYFESHRSSPDGLLAVGTVVMHRLAHGAWGNSVCSVVQSKNQFAPGLMTRTMQGNLTDLKALAAKILSGHRHPELPENVMFFHVAGMKFPYKNMRYVLAAGGNTFYYKAPRSRRT